MTYLPALSEPRIKSYFDGGSVTSSMRHAKVLPSSSLTLYHTMVLYGPSVRNLITVAVTLLVSSFLLTKTRPKATGVKWQRLRFI